MLMFYIPALGVLDADPVSTMPPISTGLVWRGVDGVIDCLDLEFLYTEQQMKIEMQYKYKVTIDLKAIEIMSEHINKV